MKIEIWMYLFMVVVSGCLSLFLCVYGQLKLKSAPGAKPYIFLTLLSTIFTFSYAFELVSTSIEQIKFWLKLEYLAIPFIPLCTLLMYFEYVGHKLNPKLTAILVSIPIITVFMHYTNGLHHLYYKSITIKDEGPFAITALEYGPWFYVHSIYLLLCIMISIIILLLQLQKSLFRFRMQIILMVIGLLIPIIANYFYLNGLSPYGIDLGPVSMSISFLFHGVAILSFQMFNLAPIARDIIFESMSEGVIVINDKGMVVDYNQKMLNIIPQLNIHAIGESLKDVLHGNQQLAAIIFNKDECDYEWNVNGDTVHYYIRFSPITNKQKVQMGQIITFVDVSEKVHIQEKLKRLASIDGLTQVYNRTYFLAESEKSMEVISNNGGYVSVIMFDVDHFKKVNDNFGHEAGDRVLAFVASIAKDNLRPTDIVGRYGGEEFIICLPETSSMIATNIAEKIRLMVSEGEIQFVNETIRVTASFGISSAVINSDEPQFLHLLMRQADSALYAAKKKGRNNVVVYEESYNLVNA